MKRRATKLFALAVLAASWAGTAIPATAGAAGCPNEAFRVGPSAALPECRAYEKVSPPDKANGDVETRSAFLISRGVPGLDEDGYAFLSYNGLPGSENGALESGNVAKRGSDGWTSAPFSPPTINQKSIPEVALSLLISRDLNKVLVESLSPLTPDAQPGANLYVRTMSPPSVQLITPIAMPIFGNTYTVNTEDIVGASDDFSHIVFTDRAQLTPNSPELSPIGGAMNLYEWNGSTLTNIGVLPGQTEPTSAGVEAPDGIDAVSPDGKRVTFREPGGRSFVLRDHGMPIGIEGTYRGASRDLSKIFTTEGGDLFRYDVESGDRENLTAVAAGGGSAVVTGQNVLVAPDGEAAFFVAGGVLAPGATSGASNLYRWSAADGIEFIAELDPSDPFVVSQTRVVTSGEAFTDATGNAVAFVSVAAPTNESPAGVREIYRWAKGEGLVCASCAPGLASPAGEAKPVASILGGAGSGPLSADGSKVFFSTTDRLVPQDTNGKMDAYEWVGGQVHLISTGSGESGSEFLGAGPSTKDVFFSTRDRLLGADRDENIDVYDAREGGGLPEPALSVSCEAEACRPPLEAAPPVLSIGSRSFDGPPNPKPKHHKKHKHRKGKARRCKPKTKRCSRRSHHGRTAGKRG